jgi:hypothetical protein
MEMKKLFIRESPILGDDYGKQVLYGWFEEVVDKPCFLGTVMIKSALRSSANKLMDSVKSHRINAYSDCNLPAAYPF